MDRIFCGESLIRRGSYLPFPLLPLKGVPFGPSSDIAPDYYARC